MLGKNVVQDGQLGSLFVAYVTLTLTLLLCPSSCAARPVRSAQGTGGAVEKERSTREAVLADAQALLAVGWEGDWMWARAGLGPGQPAAKKGVAGLGLA